MVALGLYFLFRNGNWARLKAVKNQLDYWLLLAVLGINLMNLFLMILRWYFLVKPVKNQVSLKNIYIISLNAIAANFAVPGKMGVPAKAILLKNAEGIDFSRSTPSLVNELLLEYSSMLLFFAGSAMLGGFFKWNMFRGIFVGKLGFALLFFMLIGFFLYVIFRKHKIGAESFQKLTQAFQISWLRKDLFLIAFGITVVNLLLTFWGDKLLFRSLGFDIPYIFVVFSSSFSSIASLLSPLPGGIGIREIANGYFYKEFYNLGAIAVLAVLIRRVITYISLILLFIFERSLALGQKQGEKVPHESRLY